MGLKSVVPQHQASYDFDHTSDHDAAGHVDAGHLGNGYADADHGDHDCDDFGRANADHADACKKV